MKLAEFLCNNDYQKKVLLANKVSVGNALIRQVNMQREQPTVNVECKGIVQLAASLVDAYLARSGEKINKLSPNAAKYIIINLLKNNQTFQVGDMTYGTVGEILNCLDEIRLNGTTKDFGQGCEKSLRLRELNQLRCDYEKYLEDCELYDRVRIVCRATEILSDISKKELEYILPSVKGMQLADLRHNRWSCREREFLDKLTKKLEIELQEIEWEQEGEHQIKYSIVKAYGMANEVQHVANELVDQTERKAKKPFGNVTVYYSDPVYLNYIKAAFDVAGISYVVEKGDLAVALHLTNFYIDVLKSVKNDFSYEDLEKVVFNKCMSYEYKTSEGSAEQIRTEYNRVLKDGIGWGRNRYKKYCREHEGTVFVHFLRDYIAIFDENKRVAQMLEDLMAFAKEYTYPANPDKRNINPQIKDKIRDLKHLDDRDWTLTKRVDCLLDFFENMKIDSEEKIFESSKMDSEELKDIEELENREESEELEDLENQVKTEDANEREKAVVIKDIDGIFVMERKYNYFLGMSTSAFTMSIRQSAIMLDDEKLLYIQGSNDYLHSSVTLARNKNIDRGNALKLALNTLNRGEVSFLYSDYDTVHMKEDSLCVFVSELMKGIEVSEAKRYKDWASYNLGDLYIDAQSLKDFYEGEELQKEQQEEQEEQSEQYRQPEEQSDQDGQPGTNMSASGLKGLLKCPLQYYYQYIKHLNKNEQVQFNGHEWLPANKKGTLCHAVLEKYLEQVMPPKGEVSDKIQQAVLDKVFSEQLEEIEKNQPYPSVTIKNAEIQYYKEKIGEYLAKLHVDWAKDYGESKKWKIIGCELEFGSQGKEDESPLLYRDTEDTELSYTLKLNGFIDRADGYMDEEGYLHLRVIDYKTGKIDILKKGVKNGTELQYYIYAMAIIDFIKNKKNMEKMSDIFSEELKQNGLTNITEMKGIRLEKVAYSFPLESGIGLKEFDVTKSLKSVMQGEDGDLSEMKVDLPETVKIQLRNFMGILQNKNGEGLSASMEEAIKPKVAKNTEWGKKTPLERFCEGIYCKYQDVCRYHVNYQAVIKDEDGEE